MAGEQTAANILVAIKREAVTGVADATVTGAQRIRLTDSPGLQLTRAQVQSQEKRDDQYLAMGRAGFKGVDGSFNSELHAGGEVDLLLESILRSAFTTLTAIDFGDLTTIALGSNEVVATAGDWIGTEGLRVGDIFTIAGSPDSNNNGFNTIITAITSLTLSVPAGTFITQVATATGTLTRRRKVVGATTPTRYSHTIEQYDEDIDLTELFLGCRLVGLRLSFRPGEMAQVTYTFLGMDRTALITGTSPWFDTPALNTNLGLLADDSTIRFNGAPVATFTGLDLDFAITAAGQPVIGSLVSPDIFDNDCQVSGTITGLRSDFANLTLYDAETEFELSILLTEPSGAPPECVGLFIPRAKISALSAPVGGGDGAKIETLELMIAPKVAVLGYDATPVVFSTSGP